MEARKELMTIKDTMAAIKKAKVVLIAPRFGVSEDWIEVTKKAALAFVGKYGAETTPEDVGMYGGVFGSSEEGVVYLG